MSAIDVLLFTIFISFLATVYSIQEGTMRDMNVQKLKVPRAFNRWYTLLSRKRENETSCTINTITDQSGNQYTMNVTLAYSPNEEERSHTVTSHGTYTSIILNTAGEGREANFLYVNYNLVSYLLLCTTNAPAQEGTASRRQIYIINRRHTLPDGLINELKQSEIEDDEHGHSFDIYIADLVKCE